MSDVTPPATVRLDLDSFTGAETMAMQREFECDWTDLTSQFLGKGSGRLQGETDKKLRDSAGRVRFVDEVLRHMIWTVQRRTEPTALLAPLEELNWRQLLNMLEPAEGKAGTARSRSKTT